MVVSLKNVVTSWSLVEIQWLLIQPDSRGIGFVSKAISLLPETKIRKHKKANVKVVRDFVKKQNLRII